MTDLIAKNNSKRSNPRRGQRMGHWPLFAIVFAFTLAVISLGCGKSSNSPGEPEGVGARSNGEGGTPAVADSCEPLGAFRCNPAVPEQLEVCDPATVAGWTYVETCASDAFCDPELGQCRACEPGAYRCDAWRLEACKADGSGWTLLTECDSAELCDSRIAQCSECLPGTGYCSGATLFSCNRTQDGFTALDCGSPDNCSVTSMSCRPCIVGEYQCSLENLQVCNDSRSWEVVDSCATPQLCEIAYEKLIADPEAEPTCEPPVCEVGEYKCGEGDGRNLMGCPPSQASWQLLDVCDTAERCRADLGTCADGPCLPGDMQCDGIAFQVCNSSGTAWETVKTCASADQCNIRAADCVDCTPGDVQCNGRLLQECNEAKEWITRETCASARLCTLDEDEPKESYCSPPECLQPGEVYRCDQDRLEVCNADLTWETVQSCASAGLCNATDGRCNPPGCDYSGEHRCQANVLEQCPEDLTGWTVEQKCPEGTVCDLSALDCIATCPDERFRCNGVVPEECVELEDGSIEWQVTSPPCASSALCWADEDGAGCDFPVCGGFLPDYRCNPDNPSVVERCTPGRTGWETTLTCSGQETCDPGPYSDGPAQCDICTPNDFMCGNGQLSQCGPSGQTIRLLEHCGEQSRCVDPADGSQGYCLRCNEGQTQCNGSNLDTCAPDRRGWVQAQECEPQSGCHDNPGSRDYCNVCRIPSERRCDGPSTLLTCTPLQDAWGSSTSCSFGCQDDNLSDYCRDCRPNSAQCSASSENERRACSDVGRWQGFETCPDGSDCYDAPNDGDYCGSCEPGSAVCINQTQRQVCGSDGRPGELSNCSGSTPFCLGESGACVQCLPNTSECSESGRRVCDSDGFWDTADCSDGKVCLEGECVACKPGSERCTGGSAGGREECSGAGVWETRNCTSTATPFCFEGGCAECTSTSGPRCIGSNMPGREVCVGGKWTAENCSGDGVCVNGQCQECDPALGAQCTGSDGSSERRICQGGEWVAANCSGATPICQNGACRCRTGVTRCSSASGMRQRCDQGMWVDDGCENGVCLNGECAECRDDDQCPNAAFPVCDDGTCVCRGGDERCVGSAHQLCRDTNDGNTWTSDPCKADAPICQEGACVCSTGTTRCAGGTLQTCTMGSWLDDPGTECTSCTDTADCGRDAPICSGGICQPCSSNPDNCMEAVCVDGSCVECSASNATYCDEGEVCNANNECAPCDADNPCRGGLVCVGGACEVGECSDGEQRCSGGARQLCDEGRWEDDPCENPQPVCGDSGTCRPCTSNAECGTNVCVDGSCTVAQCMADEARCEGPAYQVCDEGTWETEQICEQSTPLCEATKGCVQCEADDDCGGATPTCKSNSCVECASNADCGTTNPICSNDQCVGCESDAECTGLGGTCASDGSCISAECASNADCTQPDLPSCFEGSCVQCTANEDCGGDSPICSSNECSGCSDDAQCADLGGLCTGSGACQTAMCVSGEAECNGAAFRVCEAGRWRTEDTCNGATPLCSDAVGCVECIANENCDEATPICASNTCVECTNGSNRCEGSVHERCVENVWSPEPCDSGEVCNPDSGTCAAEEVEPPAGGDEAPDSGEEE